MKLPALPIPMTLGLFGLFALMLYACYEMALMASMVGVAGVGNVPLSQARCLSYTGDSTAQDTQSKAPCLLAPDTEGFAPSKLVIHSPFQAPLSSTSSETLITYYDLPNSRPAAHASSLVDISEVSDKSFMLLYFAGTREGARDVGIYQSFYTLDSEISESAQINTHSQDNADTSAPTQGFRARGISSSDTRSVAGGKAQLYELNGEALPTQDPARSDSDNLQGNNNWTKPTLLLDAPTLSHLSGKFVKKLGNPVGFVDTQGRAHLFVVGVSLGGWATSKIYWLMFEPDLHSLRFVKELRLSPFLNFSHLVRTPPIAKSDGGFYLPIYHELARKYPLIYEVGSSLEGWEGTLSAPLGFHTPFSGEFAPLSGQLQPSFVSIDERESFGIYRNHKGNEHVMSASVCDQNGCKIVPTNLKNYDSSSVLFALGQEVFLLHNQKAQANGNNREELWIYHLDNRAELFAPRLEPHETGKRDEPSQAPKAHFSQVLRLDYLPGDEVSYPSAIVSEHDVMIAYTHGRKFIRAAFVSFEALGVKAEPREQKRELHRQNHQTSSEGNKSEAVFAFNEQDRALSERWSILSWSILLLALMCLILQSPLRKLTRALRAYLATRFQAPMLLTSLSIVLLLGLCGFVLLLLFHTPFGSSLGVWSAREYVYGLFDLPSVMSVFACLVWLEAFVRSLSLSSPATTLDSETSESSPLKAYFKPTLIKMSLLCGLWSGFGAVVYFGFLGYDLLGWGLDIYHLHIKISLLIFISLGLISYILYPLAGFGVVASLIAYSYDVMGAMSVYHYVLDPFLWLGALVGLALCLVRLVRNISANR